MSNGLNMVKNDFAQWVKKVTDPSNMQGALAKTYVVYQKFQLERFQTENASEGQKWPALNATYKSYKLKRYGGGSKRATQSDPRTQWQSWPGGGRKMLIGTGTLAGAVIGPSRLNPFDQSGISAHRAMFTSSSMTVMITANGLNAEGKPFVYPSIVDQTRPFMKFSDQHIQEMKKTIAQYVIGKKK